jgi:hypothetical protein
LAGRRRRANRGFAAAEAQSAQARHVLVIPAAALDQMASRELRPGENPFGVIRSRAKASIQSSGIALGTNMRDGKAARAARRLAAALFERLGSPVQDIDVDDVPYAVGTGSCQGVVLRDCWPVREASAQEAASAAARAGVPFYESHEAIEDPPGAASVEAMAARIRRLVAGDAAAPRRRDQGLASARDFVARVVGRMVRDGYPVEEVHKAGHAPDRIPVEHFGWDPEHYEETLGLALVGGWQSKAALAHLIVAVRDETARDATGRGAPARG